MLSFKIFPLAPFKDSQLVTTGQEHVLVYAELYLQTFCDLDLQIHWNSRDTHVLVIATFRAGWCSDNKVPHWVFSTIKDLTYSPKL